MEELPAEAVEGVEALRSAGSLNPEDLERLLAKLGEGSHEGPGIVFTEVADPLPLTERRVPRAGLDASGLPRHTDSQ